MSEKVRTALFVFIPFCKIKCTYCDFNVYANLARAMEPYADAVAKEIRNSKFVIRNSSPSAHHAKTVYLGGGTPSLIPTAHVEKILRAIHDTFEVSSAAEITLEANPGTMDAAKLHDLRLLGINRLSIGVQAFDDAALKRLNRGHTVADALKTYDNARRAGFDNVNLDFIYGLPLQTMGEWHTTLERALALGPEHLSLYALKVEEGTGLEFQIRRGKYPIPNDDLAADMYATAEEMLETAGYAHYEISNWARVGARHSQVKLLGGRGTARSNKTMGNPDLAKASPLQSVHNLTYWLNQPYLGFGAGAHSNFGGARYWNVLSPLDYMARIEHGESVVDGREEIGRELEMAETMILGLRLSRGIVFDEFQERFGQDARTKYAAQLAELTGLGLIEIKEPERLKELFGSRLCLTERGRLLSNEVFWRFLP